MKSLAKLVVVCGVMLVGAVANGQHLTPVPEAPIVYGGAPVMMSEMAAPLYTNVKVKDRDEMAPCAVPKIITVKDPCACDNGCCGPQCVSIQICVPSCACESVKCSKDGDRIRYDYGKYAVDVRIKKGYIEVDYQD